MFFCSILSLFISLFFAVLIAKFGLRFSLVDTPNERSSHKRPTPRSGGIGIWLAFVFASFLFTEYIIFPLFAGIIGFVCLLEDIFVIPQKIRLVLQLIISTVVIGQFLGVSTSVVSILLFVFWIIFVTGTANFYNFMDGIDGIAGFTGFVAFGLLALYSFVVVHEPDIVLMSVVLSIGCFGFLFVNFPKAKVFMGDVGSIFLGFVFASFLVKLSTSINAFMCLIMFLCMFYADSLITIFYRWQKKENLMKAHRSHLYQYMCNELRIPHWKVSLTYAFAQLFFGILALLAYNKGLIWQVIVLAIFGIMFLISYKFIKGIKPDPYLSS